MAQMQLPPYQEPISPEILHEHRTFERNLYCKETQDTRQIQIGDRVSIRCMYMTLSSGFEGIIQKEVLAGFWLNTKVPLASTADLDFISHQLPVVKGGAYNGQKLLLETVIPGSWSRYIFIQILDVNNWPSPMEAEWRMVQSKIQSIFIDYVKNDEVVSNQGKVDGLYDMVVETVQKYKRVSLTSGPVALTSDGGLGPEVRYNPSSLY